MNANKTEYMCFKQGAISTLSGNDLKLVDKFMYIVSSVPFTGNDINIHLMKVWNGINKLSII